MQLKSIKIKLSLIFGVLILFICAALGTIGFLVSKYALTDSINESLPRLTKEAAKVVHERINSQLDSLEVLAENDLIKSDELDISEKLKILRREAERVNHLYMTIIDTTGNGITTNGDTANASEREYFKAAMSGERAVSDPAKSLVSDDLIVIYAVPIKDGNRIKGVLTAVRDGNELSELISDIKPTPNGEAVMINNEGTIIAHKDRSLVISGYNTFEQEKNDPGLTSLVEIQKKMIAGEEGVGEYTFKGITKYMGYAPIEGTKWSLSVTAPREEVMGKVDSLLITVIILSVILLVVGTALTYFISSSISKPIKTASEYLKLVATGDFTQEVPVKLLKAKDETGVLAAAINTMQTSLRSMIKQVIDESTTVSEMLNNVNSNMEELNKGIEEVSATTEEMAAITEQTASSAEEMSATSTEIERAVESIAAKAQEGAAVVNNVSKMAEEMKKIVKIHLA